MKSFSWPKLLVYLTMSARVSVEVLFFHFLGEVRPDLVDVFPEVVDFLLSFSDDLLVLFLEVFVVSLQTDVFFAENFVLFLKLHPLYI